MFTYPNSDTLTIAFTALIYFSNTLIRTIENILSETYSYDVTTDGYTDADDLRFIAYQVSNVYGTGYASEHLIAQGI